MEGEIAQGRSVGRIVSRGDYRRMVAGKSGELFGVAAALGRHRIGEETTSVRRLGVRIGSLYQMVDDFLDFCPDAPSGKAAYQDYRQGKWTWVMDHVGLPGFGLRLEQLPERLFVTGADGRSPMARALAVLDGEVTALSRQIETDTPEARQVVELMRSWSGTCRRALADHEGAYLQKAAGPSRPRTRSGHVAPRALAS